ncbi:MAG: energy-coupling factor ABC transporter ATP-binding protein [Cyanobacteria bacterium J06650_10]
MRSGSTTNSANHATTNSVNKAPKKLTTQQLSTNATSANNSINRPAIATQNLTFQYPNRAPVLNNISLTIQQGQRVGIIGHNGCGKTTLFMLLCGLLTPTSGEISLLDKFVVPGEFRPEVGMLFQDPDDQLFSPTVREDIGFGPQNMGLDAAGVAQQVDRALKITGMEPLAERTPHHLSGGEKQMVAIAGLLAMQPQVVLYDEPTASLDLRTRRRLIGFLQKSSETMVISSHDLEFVLDVCDRILLIDNGQIIADGDPLDIMGNASLMEAHGLEKPHSLIPHVRPHHRRLTVENESDRELITTDRDSLQPAKTSINNNLHTKTEANTEPSKKF